MPHSDHRSNFPERARRSAARARNHDLVKGQKDEDILIGGVTPVDRDLAALSSIMQEWTKTDVDMDGDDDQDDLILRATAIRDAYFVGMVTSDGSKDELDGGQGADWFIADTDVDGDKIKDHNEDIFGLDNDCSISTQHQWASDAGNW